MIRLIIIGILIRTGVLALDLDILTIHTLIGTDHFIHIIRACITGDIMIDIIPAIIPHIIMGTILTVIIIAQNITTMIIRMAVSIEEPAMYRVLPQLKVICPVMQEEEAMILNPQITVLLPIVGIPIQHR